MNVRLVLFEGIPSICAAILDTGLGLFDGLLQPVFPAHEPVFPPGLKTF